MWTTAPSNSTHLISHSAVLQTAVYHYRKPADSYHIFELLCVLMDATHTSIDQETAPRSYASSTFLTASTQSSSQPFLHNLTPLFPLLVVPLLFMFCTICFIPNFSMRSTRAPEPTVTHSTRFLLTRPTTSLPKIIFSISATYAYLTCCIAIPLLHHTVNKNSSCCSTKKCPSLVQ